MLEKFKFADSQTFSNLDSTGEKSTLVWDLETIGSESQTDDQVMGGGILITIISAPAQATIAGTEGLVIEVRTDAAEALTTLPEIVGCISVLPSKVLTGAQFYVPCHMDVCQLYLGVWLRDYSTDFVGDIVIDADWVDGPVTPNEGLQKSIV